MSRVDVTAARTVSDAVRMRPGFLCGLLACAVLAGASVALLLPVLIRAEKIGLYLESLDRSGLLYILLLSAVPVLFLILKYRRLPIYALAFALPFNVIGGEWGESSLVNASKVVLNLLFVTSLYCVILTNWRQWTWLWRTSLGVSLLFLWSTVAMGIVVGLAAGVRTGEWLRESNWMTFYAFAPVVGTLCSRRRHIRRLVWATVAGAVMMQGFAFFQLATGQRYERIDSWEGGATFFRAPFSSASLFVLYLALSALLVLSCRRQLTTKRQAILLAGIVAFGGGLLASMGRSLWISAAVGLLVVFALNDWNRRSARAVIAVAGGAAFAFGLVVAVDRLSPSSSGAWAANALSFFRSLGGEDTASTAGRRIEWVNALDVWTRSPLIGVGFGYSFPESPYSVPSTDKFYMHNSYLNVLAKCGVLGMCALLAVAVASVRFAVGTIRTPIADVGDRVISTAVAASLIQMLFLSVFSPVITTSDSILFFALLLGTSAALHRIVSPPIAA
jgi:hypothetical protein